MKKRTKALSFFLVLIVIFSSLSVSAFAKEFAPVIDISTPGMQTQYLYDTNDPSWLRKLVIKEDMLSTTGIFTELPLYPVTDYPYTNDAKGFNAEVEEYMEIYSLDEESRRAAYIYFLEQIGALSIISDPSASEKADTFRRESRYRPVPPQRMGSFPRAVISRMHASARAA